MRWSRHERKLWQIKAKKTTMPRALTTLILFNSIRRKRLDDKLLAYGKAQISQTKVLLDVDFSRVTFRSRYPISPLYRGTSVNRLVSAVIDLY